MLNHVPLWPIEAKCLAGMPVKFDEGNMFDTRLLQAKRLPSSACAKFKGC